MFIVSRCATQTVCSVYHTDKLQIQLLGIVDGEKVGTTHIHHSLSPPLGQETKMSFSEQELLP